MNSLKVALLYYPMLFQRTGGLQIQVLETEQALRSVGVDACLFDYRKHHLESFHVAHVFSAINGNHRVIEQARASGNKIVLSTVLQPPWSPSWGRWCGVLSQITGRLTKWEVSTTYQHVLKALQHADALVALGGTEKDMLIDGYGVDSDKVSIVANGVKRAFFDADGELFRSRMGIEGDYVLNVSSISPYKNQLSLVKALNGKLPLVVIGPVSATNCDYLDTLHKAGGDAFIYAGVLHNEDPLLASAYAGASLFALPSVAEVQPISVLEALAADCPVVLTKNHSLDVLPDRSVLYEVSPHNEGDIAEAIESAFVGRPPVGYYSEQVKNLTWENAAERLKAIYLDLIAS